MGQLLKSTEPTIWALRKNVKKQDGRVPSLYEHLYGYDPIKVILDNAPPAEADAVPTSASNPKLNILNPATNFVVMEIASDEPSEV